MRNSVKRALVLVLSVLLATGNPGLTALAEDLASSHEGSALVDGGAKSVADDFSVRPADDRAEGRLTEEATGMSVEAQGEAVRLTDVAQAAAESDGSDATQKDAVIATAETDNSSSYTVEFTYGDLGYALPGGSSVAVSEVLAALGLTGEATAVEVSDASLFSASDESGGWVVTAHRAFSTTERMRVTMGGVAYEITVTDDQDAVTYIDADGTQKTLTAYTPLTGSETAWTGWYVASGEVYIDSRVEVVGEAHLVLVDGAALHIPKGITVNSGNSLTIYGQSYDTGALTIDKVNEYNAAAAGIGGGYYSQQSDGDLDGSPSNLVVGRPGGAVTINGGTVNVVGNVRGTCIGGGDAAGGGAITINGGKVTATSSIINGGGIGNGNLAGGATIELSLPAGGSDFIQASRYSGALRIKEGCALRPDGDTQTFYTDKHNGSIDPSALRNVKLVYCPYPCAVDDQAAHVTSSHKLAPEGWTLMLALEEGYAGLPGVTYSADGQAHAVDLAKVDDAT
ncbi:MAG: hypothetical protein UHS51_06845, partial [Atopobiaceae bacterium]|nr:hypothetical protein [Atopobiaceae bacterium]